MYVVDKYFTYRDGVRGAVAPEVASFQDRRAAELWAALLNFAANMMPGTQETEYEIREVKRT